MIGQELERTQYVDHPQTTIAEAIGLEILRVRGASLTLEALMRRGFTEQAGGWHKGVLLDVAGSPDDLQNRQTGGWYSKRRYTTMKSLTIGAALVVISLGTGAQSFAQSASTSSAKAAVMADHTLRTSKLLHARVYNATGEEIGTIGDVLVDPKGGEPRAILSVGKYLGKKNELVAVPLSSIELGSGRMVMAQGTKAHMAEMKRFSYGSPLEGGGG